MTLAEIINLPDIPRKVSLNEYIERSTQYRAPQSKAFIYGILDNLVTDLKEQKKIKKTGKGLKV